MEKILSNKPNNGNGKWAFAFWIVTSFFVMISVMLGNHVIANDRIREAQDEKLNCKIDSVQESIYSKMEQQFGLLRIETSTNSKKLSSIEAKLEILKDLYKKHD